jgi:hypothetical protein
VTTTKGRGLRSGPPSSKSAPVYTNTFSGNGTKRPSLSIIVGGAWRATQNVPRFAALNRVFSADIFAPAGNLCRGLGQVSLDLASTHHRPATHL